MRGQKSGQRKLANLDGLDSVPLFSGFPSDIRVISEKAFRSRSAVGRSVSFFPVFWGFVVPQ